jgi:N-acetylglucosamine-6-phosphate deacetylase
LNHDSRSKEKSQQLFVPTLFLPKGGLENLELACRTLAKLRREGRVHRILGIGIEGPLLGSEGGTPRNTHWTPTPEEWSRIAALGDLGLIYCVLSFSDGLDLRFQDRIVEELCRGGVVPALGHFRGSSDANLVRQIDAAVEIGHSCRRPILTDHLFNDMPLAFRHAWRSGADRSGRTHELMRLARALESGANLASILGRVPATMIRHAQRGGLTLCINFDGAHVDLGVLALLKPLLPSKNVIAMTDRVEHDLLSCESLTYNPEDTLFYNKARIVSAGSSTIPMQAFNLLTLGYTIGDIYAMTRRHALTYCGTNG